MLTLFLTPNTMEMIPGESFLMSCLQKKLCFCIGDRTIRRGRLLLFKRVHYYIHISLLNEKGIRENVELPIPFSVEIHTSENLLYFDYRPTSLGIKLLPPIPEKVASTYFNKILEISIAD